MRRRLPSLAGLLVLALPAWAQDISLRLPLACEVGRSCFIQHYVDRDPSPAASDHQCGTLTYEGHDGTDFRLPDLAALRAGVDVVAAADGTVAAMREGVPDAFLAPDKRDEVSRIGCGNAVVIDHAGGWRTAYCHLARGSVAVRSGAGVKAGEKIGRVGLSGLTEFPHLHFTVLKDGRAVDPFAFGAPDQACGGGKSLWQPSVQRTLGYQAGSVLNTGFAAAPVTMEAVESGAVGRQHLATSSPALVAYVRAIGLRGGDVQTLTLFGADGQPLARNQTPPLDRHKAQWMTFAGVKQPAGGFPPGVYRAVYRVERDGKPAIEQAFTVTLGP